MYSSGDYLYSMQWKEGAEYSYFRSVKIEQIGIGIPFSVLLCLPTTRNWMKHRYPSCLCSIRILSWR